MWSLSPFFLFKKENERFNIRLLLNPPVMAIVAGLVLKRFAPAFSLPEVIFSPMEMLGQMSFALSILLGLRITDGQTGFRGISKGLALSYRLKGEYTYTQEMIIQAKFLGAKIIEVPIFFDKRVSGSSRLISSPIDYAWRSWLTILRTLRDFQPIWFFGGFGFLSLLLGLFIFSITAVSSVTITVPFDLTILSTILILMGVQFIFFGFLADANKPVS